MVRLPAVIFPNSVEVRLKPQVPPQLDVPNPIVDAAWEARIVVPAVPLLKVPLKARFPAVMDRALFPVLNAEATVKVPVPSLSVSASIVVAPADVKLSLMLMPLVALRVVAPAADIPPVVASKVMEPADEVSNTPEAREMLSSESTELLESPSRIRLPAEVILLAMSNPLAADNVRAPCPVMVPPLWPMVNFPRELKLLEIEEKVISEFTRLRSPFFEILPNSVSSIFIPKPELKPMPKEPPSETLMVVEPVPLFKEPVRVKSLAVMVSALFPVDKVPEDIVKSPEPLLSRSASRATAPVAVKPLARVIPELAVMVTAPTDDNELLTVMLPLELSVSAPLLAVIDPPEAPRIMFPPDEVIFIPLASESALPPCRVMSPVPVKVLLLKVRPLAAVIVTAPRAVKLSVTVMEEPVEVRVTLPRPEIPPVVASSDKAPPALKLMPPAKVNLSVEADPLSSASASIVRDPVVLIPLFKVTPLLAESEISPAPVKAPVRVILESAVRVKAPAALIPPLVALKEISPALVKVIPLTKLILSTGSLVSTPLSESPSRARDPTVVVRSELTSIPFTALAVKAENEEAELSKTIAPFEPDRCASTFNSTPFAKLVVSWVNPST